MTLKELKTSFRTFIVFFTLKVFIQSFQSFFKVVVILHKAIDFKGFWGLLKVFLRFKIEVNFSNQKKSCTICTKNKRVINTRSYHSFGITLYR